jgi:hypothetical protein
MKKQKEMMSIIT